MIGRKIGVESPSSFKVKLRCVLRNSSFGSWHVSIIVGDGEGAVSHSDKFRVA